MSTDRPPTPSPTKRILRQEAGFGCCACSFPVYQYHHIIPWEDEPHFRPADMMILCPNYHDQATKGAMSEEEQRRYKASPLNIQRGYAQGLLVVDQPYCALDVGGGVFLVGDGPWIEVDGESILTLGRSSEGGLLLTLLLYDEHDTLVAHIDDNEWLAGDASTWDMESDWQRLVLRLAPRHVAIRIDARRLPTTLRGELWRHGARFRFGGSSLEVSGSRRFANLGLVRMGLRFTSATNELRFGPKPGDDGYMVSEADPIRRLVKSIDAWRGRGANRLRA
jgi:hypothetical protein